MRKAVALFALLLWNFTSGAPKLWAKGLGELTDKNPEAQDDSQSDDVRDVRSDGQGPGTVEEGVDADEESSKATPAVSDFSKRLSGKVTFVTSAGWAKVSQSGGVWKSGGFSDFGLYYQLSSISETKKLAISYRYAPVGVSGLVEGHSYRGIWEAHNFGGQIKFKTSRKTIALASAELGFLKANLRPTDGLAAERKASKGGALLSLGGGVDYFILDRSEFTIGPRIYLGLGAARQQQLSIAFGFGF